MENKEGRQNLKISFTGSEEDSKKIIKNNPIIKEIFGESNGNSHGEGSFDWDRVIWEKSIGS
ncbi:hypothetical protein PDN38_25760 [Bacillus cereus]|nr:hypothetical protein [Bacillus cereus]